MRNARVWQGVLGLVRTVLEGVSFDEDEGAVVAEVRPRKGARCGADGVDVGRRGSTGARAGADGGRWTWGRCRCTWKPTPRG